MGGRWLGLAKGTLAADGSNRSGFRLKGRLANRSGFILKETLANRWGFRLKGTLAAMGGRWLGLDSRDC